MTRKEEREQASFEYHSKPYLGAIKDDFINGAEWADKTMLDKADKAIEKLLSGYIIRNFNFGDSYDIDKFIEDFKNYMKGE